MDKPKHVFFVKPRLDNFINPLIDHLSAQFWTKKVIVTDMNQIPPEMEWADVCWFEWCDDLIVYGSKLPVAYRKKIICRLHSYEAFTSYPHRVNWNAVDKVIFDGKHIQQYVLKQVQSLDERQTLVIPNGVIMEKFPLIHRKKGFNIAYVGYINYKKGPMLLLHAFKEIHDRDERYKLFIAGAYQDNRYLLYFQQMIREMDLAGSVQFDGWQKDVNRYLQDKHYIISTSLLESQHMSIMEAMASGIKPLVHNFYGAKQVYDESYLWNTIGDLTDMVMEDDYSPVDYRAYIERNYSFAEQIVKVEKLIVELTHKPHMNQSSVPKITIGIINYNYGHYLDECLSSVFSQQYPNKEIIIVDDHSTDNSMEILGRYQQEYTDMRIIRQPVNTSLPDQAFHLIFREASGEYVLLVSADDYLPHERILENYMKCFSKNNNLDYVYGDITLVDNSGRRIGEWTYKSYSDQEAVGRVYKRWGSGVIPMIGMFKAAYYQSNNHSWFVDPLKPIAGDSLNCLINIKRGWNRHYLNETMLCYRRHRNSISHNNINNRIISLVYIMEYIVKNFSEDVYEQSVSWNQYDGRMREALKHYSIGKHYAEMALYYQTCSFTKGLDANQKKLCVQPILERMNHYFEMSLACEDAYEQSISEMIEQLKPLVL